MPNSLFREFHTVELELRSSRKDLWTKAMQRGGGEVLYFPQFQSWILRVLVQGYKILWSNEDETKDSFFSIVLKLVLKCFIHFINEYAFKSSFMILHILKNIYMLLIIIPQILCHFWLTMISDGASLSPSVSFCLPSCATYSFGNTHYLSLCTQSLCRCQISLWEGIHWISIVALPQNLKRLENKSVNISVSIVITPS